MQKYELLLVLPGTLDDKEVEARAEEVVSLVSEFGSDVTRESMGKNRLAYPVRQIRYGYYFVLTFQAEQKTMKALEKKLALRRDILRACISHFNVNLSAQQKLAFTSQQSAAAPAMEKELTESQLQEKIASLIGDKQLEAVPESKVARPVEKLDIDQINKKLDDLISGDVIPGV